MERKSANNLVDELRQSLCGMSAELRRVEMRAAALAGFSRPVPAYQPQFSHIGANQLGRHQIGTRREGDEA